MAVDPVSDSALISLISVL